jgi:hypothetical protein
MRAWLKHKFTSDDIQNGGSWHNISYHLGGLAQADSWPQVGGGWINAPKSSLGFCQKSGNEAHFFQPSHGEGIIIAVAKRADYSVLPPADEYIYSFRAHCCSFQIQTKNDIGNEYPHRVERGNQRIIR